jgi:hypothetical protein
MSNFKELQQGARGIFVGFPDGQAGWLIFVQEKISGSHLIVSMDFMFDQMFLTGITASIKGFGNSQDTRKIGNPPTKIPMDIEHTGDVTNLADFQMSHWGSNETFESDHQMQEKPTSTSLNNNKEISIENEDSNSTSSSDSEEEDNDNKLLGMAQINGTRRSRRLQQTNEMLIF